MEKLKFKIEEETSEMSKYREEALASILNDVNFLNLVKDDGFTIEEIKDNVGKFDRYHKSYLKNLELKKYEDCKKQNQYFMYFLKKDEDGFMIELNREFDAFHRYMEYAKRFIYSDFDINNLYKRLFSGDQSLKDLATTELQIAKNMAQPNHYIIKICEFILNSERGIPYKRGGLDE